MLFYGGTNYGVNKSTSILKVGLDPERVIRTTVIYGMPMVNTIIHTKCTLATHNKVLHLYNW